VSAAVIRRESNNGARLTADTNKVTKADWTIGTGSDSTGSDATD
jgi:hypothetical protein